MSKSICILRHSSIERLSLIPYRPVHDIYLPQWPFQGHFHLLSGIHYFSQQRHLPTAVVNIQLHASELGQHGRFYIVQPATNIFASVPVVQWSFHQISEAESSGKTSCFCSKDRGDNAAVWWKERSKHCRSIRIQWTMKCSSRRFWYLRKWTTMAWPFCLQQYRRYVSTVLIKPVYWV